MTDTITLPRGVVQQALEALELAYAGTPVITVHGKAITALKAELEQQKPPPEAQTEAEKIAYCAGWWAAMEQKREQPEQEPLAIATVDESLGVVFKFSRSHTLLPGQMLYVYTHPPRREWRSFSEGALMGLYIDFDRKADKQWTNAEYLLRLMDTVQAKLKEKNHE